LLLLRCWRWYCIWWEQVHCLL